MAPRSARVKEPDAIGSSSNSTWDSDNILGNSGPVDPHILFSLSGLSLQVCRPDHGEWEYCEEEEEVEKGFGVTRWGRKGEDQAQRRGVENMALSLS